MQQFSPSLHYRFLCGLPFFLFYDLFIFLIQLCFFFSLFLSIVQLWYSATHPVLDKMSSPAFFFLFFFFHPHLTIHSDSVTYRSCAFLCVWFSFLHFKPVPIPRVYIYVCSSLNLSLSHELIVRACVSLHVSRVELTFSCVCFLPQPLCSHQSFCIVDNVAWCGVCNVEWKLLFDLEGVKPLWLWMGSAPLTLKGLNLFDLEGVKPIWEASPEGGTWGRGREVNSSQQNWYRMLARQQNLFFFFFFFFNHKWQPHWHTFWNLYSFFTQGGASDHVDVLLLMLLAWRGGWVGKLPVDLSCIFKIHTRNNLWTLVFMFIIVSVRFLIHTHFFFLSSWVSHLSLCGVCELLSTVYHKNIMTHFLGPILPSLEIHQIISVLKQAIF